MSTQDNLNQVTKDIPSGEGMRFGIVVSDWNAVVTSALEKGAFETLTGHGVIPGDIRVIHVPGSFELPLGGQFLAETETFDAIILLGCVIQGETRHFDFVCQGVTQGTIDLNLKYDIPFLFGVLTTDNLQQALDRSGGRLGNKGSDVALAAIQMGALKRSL
jgi:6,7-dimethyl-8-ribityllumazine synthase